MEFYLSRKVALVLLLLTGAGIYILGGLTSNFGQQVMQLSEDRLVPIYKVDTEEKQLAITLDGMWGAEHTPRLLDIFEEHEITITFFFGGNWLEDYPEMAKEITARGHEIGNHTYSHPHLNSLSRAEVEEELNYNQQLIEDLVGEQPKLFRPPFGEYNNQVIEVAENLDFQTIQWSIDSLDWKNPGADFIVERILDKAGPGDIILMHNNATHTPDALEILIPKLQEQDYELVKLSELTYDQDYYIEGHSGLQRKLGN